MAQKVLFSCLLIGILAFSGCGNNIRLKGKVTFADDGSPVTCGEVHFDDGKIVARGPIQADGTYVAGLEKERSGLPPGTYRVTIVNTATLIPSENPYIAPTYEPIIHTKYTSAEKSGLSVIVDNTTKEYNIEVDRPGK